LTKETVSNLFGMLEMLNQFRAFELMSFFHGIFHLFLPSLSNANF